MDLNDVVFTVMSHCDVDTMILLRQVSSLFYNMTESAIKYPYSFTRSFWDVVFVHNARSSYSSLYRTKTQSLVLAVNNNDTQRIEKDSSDTVIDYVIAEASYLGRYSILDKLISDPLSLFLAKLGSAITTSDIEMIESLYCNISETELNLVRDNKDMVFNQLLTCRNFRLIMSIVSNFPYMLPVKEVSKEDILEFTTSFPVILVPYGEKYAHGWEDLFIASALVNNSLDDADLIASALDLSEIDWDATTSSNLSPTAIQWLIGKLPITYRQRLLNKLIKENNIESAKYLTELSKVTSLPLCNDVDSGDGENNIIRGFNLLLKTLNVSELRIGDEALISSIISFNFDAIDYILSLKHSINWTYVFSRVCCSMVLAHVHLLLKCIPSDKICKVSKPTRCTKVKAEARHNKPVMYLDSNVRTLGSFLTARGMSLSETDPETDEDLSFNDMLIMSLQYTSPEILMYMVDYCSKRDSIDWDSLINIKMPLHIRTVMVLRMLYKRHNNGKEPFQYEDMQ